MLCLLSAGVLVLYAFQFEETNAYIGISPIRQFEDIEYWLLAAIWIAAVAWMFPSQVRCPSDIFLALYLLGTTLWSATYWPATGYLTLGSAALLGVVLIMPAGLVFASQWLARHLRGGAGASMAWMPQLPLVPTLVGLLAVTSVLGYRAAGADAGFDFEEAFLRRLYGRDAFAGQAVAAYLIQMSMNGFAPFLAFVSVWRRSVLGLAVALGFAVFSFWLLAAKSPLLNVLILAGLGYLVRSGRVAQFGRWLVWGFALVLFMAVVELSFSEMSLIGEFFVRRLILVSTTIQAYFFAALSDVSISSLLLDGLPLAGYSSPEYFIGANYMGNELTNANTNAYLHQMAIGGVVGYAVVVVGTAVLMVLLDLLYLRSKRVEGFAIAAMVGILLVEQAFFTTLLSSGIFLCLALIVMSSHAKPQRRGVALNYP